MARFANRLAERNDLSVPRGATPRMGARYDADAFGRFSEAIARFLGTGRFLVGQTVMVIGWIVLNTIGIVNHWDPYPFILLNLAFSTQAAYAAPLILLAQNRQDDRDRANIERDREVAARTQADTEFLARELAAVRLALSDVVTTKDLEDSMEQLAKLIAEQLRISPVPWPRISRETGPQRAIRSARSAERRTFPASSRSGVVARSITRGSLYGASRCRR
jgi:Predicted membrane protein